MAGWDAGPRNSDDRPRRDRKSAARPPALRWDARTPSPDPVARYTPAQHASARRRYRRSPTDTGDRRRAPGGSVAWDRAQPKREPAAAVHTKLWRDRR